MGIKLSTSAEDNLPTVDVTNKKEDNKKGKFFIGVLLEHRQVDSQYKNEDGTAKKYNIYDFEIEDSDMGIQKKIGKEFADVDVKQGDKVAVFAPTRLNNALKRAAMGDRVKIVYMGPGKATKFGGRPHEFEAEVL